MQQREPVVPIHDGLRHYLAKRYGAQQEVLDAIVATAERSVRRAVEDHNETVVVEAGELAILVHELELLRRWHSTKTSDGQRKARDAAKAKHTKIKTRAPIVKVMK